MKVPKEHSCPYCHASATLGAVYYDQNCAGCVKRMSAPKPVSMEPQIMGMEEVDFNEFKPVYGYTADQLAAARQQGAEEERKKRLDWAVAWKELDVNVLHSRIAELEKSNAQLLEALRKVRNNAGTPEAVYNIAKEALAIAEVKP